MRILVLTPYYWPEPMPLPHELSRGMMERGHEVLVITGFPNYPRGAIYEGYRQRLWQWDEVEGVKVLRLPLIPDHSLSALRRSAYYMSLPLAASAIGPLLSGPADVIFVFDLITMCIPAWLIGLMRGAPFVYNLQDMFPESLEALGISRGHMLYRAVGGFCGFLYKKAAAISVISPGFKKNLAGKGVPEEKVHVIYSWADERIYRPVGRDERLARETGLGGRFNVMYAGNIGAAQGLWSVMEAARMLRAKGASGPGGIQFVFVGEGSGKPALKRMAREAGLGNVRFIPGQPASRMADFFALADVLLVSLTDAPLCEITIPLKTHSYLACGKPVLMAARGDAAGLVSAAQAGLVARPGDAADLAGKVMDLYLMPARKRKKMGELGRDFYLKNLTAAAGIERYERLFRQVAEDRLTGGLQADGGFLSSGRRPYEKNEKIGAPERTGKCSGTRRY